MTTTTGPRTAGPRTRPARASASTPARTLHERTSRLRLRLRGPAWLDGPMTSCHLVLGAAGLLLTIGLVMVFSASSIEAAMADQPVWRPAVDQIVFAAIGLAALLVAMRLPVGLIRRWSPFALLGVGVLLLVVLIPGIGVEYNGSRAWINLGFTNFQPSELAKLVFALWGAHILALRERYLTTRSLMVPVLPVYAVLAVLFLLENDFGAVVTLGLVLVGLLWGGGLPWRYFGWFVVAAVVAIVAMIKLAPYRVARITSFLDPFADPTDSGFQAIRGFYALATGGLWGVGLGNSAMKWNLLPEAESDYIFAIIGEELGFLGCLVVVILYGVLAYAGFRIARRSADRFVQLACVAITVWLVGQAAMNMGYVVGLLPVTGVTLPLISAGGTSLVLTLFIVGLLARFARSEPEAIEAQRGRARGRLARFFLPVPVSAVDAVRPRRRAEESPAARRPSVVSGGRTVVRARRGAPEPVPPRADGPPAPRSGPAEPAGARRRPVPGADAIAPREKAAPGRPRREDPPRAGARRPVPAASRPRGSGGPR